MKAVQAQAQKLALEFVPESRIAGELDAALAETQLALRSYGLTAENSYLEATRKGLDAVHAQQQAAQKLADEHPELVKLHEDLRELDPALKNFEDLINQTEIKNKDIVTSRERLNKTAADFIANIEKLIASQRERMEQEIKAFAEVSKTQERLSKLTLANEIRAEGNAARIAVFKSQALRDPALIEAGLKNFDVMDKNFDQLLAMLHVPGDIAELNQVVTDAHGYRETMKEIMADNLTLAELAKKRLEAAEKVRSLATGIQTVGMKRTVDAANSSNQSLASASQALIIGLSSALVIGVLVAFFIIRGTNRVLTNVTETLSAGADQTADAAGQVAAASQSLAEGASEQAASLEETSASLEEMSSMTKRNADNAQDAKSTAVQTRQSADAGAEQMQSLLTAMDSIKTASEDITKILRSIDEIAFQTNILALNAAVEAARAGEAGAGFAVVADEVRNLAQRCAAAAKETAVKIEDSVKKSQEGAKISADVARSFTDIQTKVRQLDQLVAEIASASQEQSQGISQVNIAVTQMDKVTQSNAASAEESASASEELNAQAESLKDAVSTLQQLLDGTTTSQARERVSLPPGRSVHPKGSRSGASARLTLPNHGGQHSESARSAPTRDSGAAVLTSAKSTGRGGEIPMDGDFKNF